MRWRAEGGDVFPGCADELHVAGAVAAQDVPRQVGARRLAARYCRMYWSFPSAPELRGSLRGGGFAFQFAARSQAALQMLESSSLSLTTPLESKGTMTNSLPPSFPVRQEQMIQGSVANPSDEVSGSFAPWEYTLVMDSVFGTLASAVIASAKEAEA